MRFNPPVLDQNWWKVQRHLLTLEMFGGGPDRTGEENSRAFAAAQAATGRSSGGGGSPAMAGGAIQFGIGLYEFAAPLQIETTLRLQGFSSGAAGHFGTALRWPESTTGIIVQRANTMGDGLSEETGPGGDASIIQNLALLGGGGDQGVAPDDAHGLLGHGIWARARCEIHNVNISGFACNGIFIKAIAAGGSPATTGNANNWLIERCRITGCGWNGLHVDGADANAGCAIAVDASGNRLWGIHDSSFLGNTYLAAHTAANGTLCRVSHAGSPYYLLDAEAGAVTVPGTDERVWLPLDPGGRHAGYPAWQRGGRYARGGPYRSDNANARNAFYNCYSEGDQPPSEIAAPASVEGGLHGAGFVPWQSGFVRGASTKGGTLSPFTMRPAFAGRRLEMDLGSGNGTGQFVTLHAEGDHPAGLQFARWDEETGCVMLQHGRLGARIALRLTTELNTITAGRSAPLEAGRVIFPGGLFVGAGDNARFVGNGRRAPREGEFARGDIVLNREPEPGGFAGWICVEAGSPGTWKGFGAIEP